MGIGCLTLHPFLVIYNMNLHKHQILHIQFDNIIENIYSLFFQGKTKPLGKFEPRKWSPFEFSPR